MHIGMGKAVAIRRFSMVIISATSMMGIYIAHMKRMLISIRLRSMRSIPQRARRSTIVVVTTRRTDMVQEAAMRQCPTEIISTIWLTDICTIPTGIIVMSTATYLWSIWPIATAWPVRACMYRGALSSLPAGGPPCLPAPVLKSHISYGLCASTRVAPRVLPTLGQRWQKMPHFPSNPCCILDNPLLILNYH